jgi:hypothetical protein
MQLPARDAPTKALLAVDQWNSEKMSNLDQILSGYT